MEYYIALITRNVLSGLLAYGIFILYCQQGMYYQALWLMEYLYCTAYKERNYKALWLMEYLYCTANKECIIRPFGLWNIYIVLHTRNVLSGPLAYGIFILYCIQGKYYQAFWLMEYSYCTAYKESIIRPFRLWNIYIVLHTRNVLSGLLAYGIFILYCIQGMYYQALWLIEYVLHCI